MSSHPVYNLSLHYLKENLTILNRYSEESDFLLSNEAKDYKQDDYSLYEYNQDFFKDKFKTLFLRGSLNVAEELRRLLRATTFMLFEDTPLFEGTPLDPTTLRIIMPDAVMSGFILDSTYPSINNSSLEDYAGITTLQELSNYFGQSNTDVILPSAYDGLDEEILNLNDYVFSETVFVLLQYRNRSDYSEQEIRTIIRRQLFPAMAVLIENI